MILILSCTFQPNFDVSDVSSQSSSSSSLIARKNHLALLKLQKKHTTSFEELEAIATQIVQSSSKGRSAVSGTNVIKDGKKIELKTEKQFVSSARTAAIAEEPITIYAFTTENSLNNTSGFVLTCNDNRIGNILALVDDGDPLDTEAPFLKMIYANLEGYIDRTIDEYNSISDEDIAQALNSTRNNSQSRFIATYSGDSEVETGQGEVIIYASTPQDGLVVFDSREPDFYLANSPTGLADHFWEPPPTLPDGYYYTVTLYLSSWSWTDGHYATLPTEWHQGAQYIPSIYSNSPYNDLINQYGIIENVNHNSSNYLVAGCGPVAIAQLMAFHNYPTQCTLTGPYVNTPYNWTAMTMSPTVGSSSNADARTGVGVLLYEIGKRANCEYLNNATTGGLPQTGIWEGGIVKTLREMGYTIPTVPLTITANPRANGYFGPYNFYTIRTSIINQRPVLVDGFDTQTTTGLNSNGQYSGGHIWVIDGVRNMLYQEVYKYELYTDIDSDPNIVLFADRTFCNINFDAGWNWVHCNIGWGPESGDHIRKFNGWYLSGIFDTNNVTFARSTENVPRYYQYHIGILPEIHY
jgi:hypothetical protein